MPLPSPIFFRRWARPYQWVARAHGRPGWPDLRDYLIGDLTPYPDLPSLAPTRSQQDVSLWLSACGSRSRLL